MNEADKKRIHHNLKKVLYLPFYLLVLVVLLLVLGYLGWSGNTRLPALPLAIGLLAVSPVLLLTLLQISRLYRRVTMDVETIHAAMNFSRDEIEQQYRQQTQQLQQSHKLYQEMVESANSIILRWDTEGIIRFVNAYAVDFFGFSEEEMCGKSVMETIVPKTESTGRDLAFMIEDIGRNPEDYIQNENENIKKNGERIWVSWNNKAVKDEQGNTVEILSIGNNVTDRKVYEQRIYQLAHYDPLTGLPNRAMFMERLNMAMLSGKHRNVTLPVFYIDLDRFKPINDSLGHHTGDLLLKQLATRLSGCIRSNEILARMGGDEFMVILEQENTKEKAMESARHVAQHMLDVMSAPYDLNGNQIFISGSIGIVLSPDDGEEQSTLIKNADIAMYHAKQKGKNCFQFYEAHMNARALERLQMETELRKAITDNKLDIHYQPTYNLDTGKLECVEALLRWQHPELGEVPPNSFIPVAEETGLIIPLGEWVLRNVIDQAAKWRDSAGDDFVVAINLSMRQFEHKQLLVTISSILAQTGLPPENLGLEITESTIMQNSQQALEILQQLKEMGIKLFIDDFGTGYSSLARLRDLPIHTVKIDRSFIADITSHPKNARIVDTIISMAHNLSINVIAEGVENQQQLDYLCQRGCYCIQGYFISKPLAAREVEKLLGKTLEQGRVTSDE